jgi:hypothetical protein
MKNENFDLKNDVRFIFIPYSLFCFIHVMDFLPIIVSNMIWQGGECQAGNFCPNGSSSQTPCTPGYYCENNGKLKRLSQW